MPIKWLVSFKHTASTRQYDRSSRNATELVDYHLQTYHKVMETLTFNDQFNSRRITSCFIGGCHCVSAFKVIGETRESEAQSMTTEHPHKVGEGSCQVSWNTGVASIQVSKGPLDVLCLHLWGGIQDGKRQSDTPFWDTHNPSLDSLYSGGN